MPIMPFIRDQVFPPEQIGAMSEAFTCACLSLGLADRTDPTTELVANHIIQLAQTGEQTSLALYLGTMREFKPNRLV
jgi:hypothetical protein